MQIRLLKTLAIIGVLFWFSVTGNAAPGGLDPTFSGDGKLIDFFPGTGNDFSGGIALQADGKLIVAGTSDYGFESACSVSRFNADGSLDASFGAGGKRLIPPVGGVGNSCNAVALQPDGKIVIGGSVGEIGSDNFDMLVIRLNPNGSLDTSFGGTGNVTTSFTNLSDDIADIAIQPDGKIVAAGTANRGSGGSSSVFALVRYNSDGSLDTTFDSDGKVTTVIGSADSIASSVVLQPDGKIAVGGTSDASTILRFGKFTVARYNQNGSLDTSFGGTGIVTTTIAGTDTLYDLALQPDGKLVAAGDYYGGDSTSYVFALVRYNPDGSLDNSFGSGGKVTTNLGGSGDGARAVTLQPDGKIVAAGYKFRTGLNDSVFIRYNPNGSIDTSFGTGGTVVYLNPATYNSDQFSSGEYTDAVLQPDGKIVGLTGYYTGIDLDFVLLRYNSNGTLDTTFDTDGAAYADIGAGTAIGTSVVRQPDGKIVVAGYAGSLYNIVFAVARYNPDGSPDASFGTAGKVITPVLDEGAYAQSVALQPDGKIVVGGYALNSVNTPVFAVVRYNADGSLDTSFDTDGKVTLTDTSTDGAKAVLIQTDGKIVIAGTASSGADTDFFAARFNPNGSLDILFDGDGKVRTPIFSSYDYANHAALQTDGKIVVAGFADADSFNYDFAVIRYNADGSLDTTFDADGKATTPILSGEDYANAVALQADGKIILAGYAVNGENEEFALARFNPNGSLDTSFDADGKLTTQLSDDESRAHSVAVQTDGKIVAAGYVFNSSFEYDFAIARYNPNGSLDASYGTGGKSVFNFGRTGDEEQITGIALDNSGKAVIAGYSGGLLAVGRILGDSTQTAGRTPFDFDGDGRADLGVFRPGEGNWYLNNSQNGFTGIKWGSPGDGIAPADYDGDGRTDVAVWRRSEGNFYILNKSNNTVRVENFGLDGDILTVGDWDGDGKADLSTYREGSQSYFFYRGSNNNPNGNITYLAWGTSGDKPLRGDFDGDGKSDTAVYRMSNQTVYIRNSSNSQIQYITFGLSTDKFVPADYDGDGKTDIAVFRPSTGVWYILQSSNGQIRYQQFGASSDTPTAADYDGDGKADIAVYRSGQWIILRSSSGAVIYQLFGLSNDLPVEAAYTF